MKNLIEYINEKINNDEVYVLYQDDKFVNYFDEKADAENMLQQMKKEFSDDKLEVKKEKRSNFENI